MLRSLRPHFRYTVDRPLYDLEISPFVTRRSPGFTNMQSKSLSKSLSGEGHRSVARLSECIPQPIDLAQGILLLLLTGGVSVSHARDDQRILVQLFQGPSRPGVSPSTVATGSGSLDLCFYVSVVR